jgi:hypothetical protein
MDAVTPSIVDFLNSRLDEDQAVAENASQDSDEGNAWSVGARQGSWKQEARIGDDREDLVFDIKDGVCVDFDGLLAHLTRFHPARVLREVAAKRSIVELHGLSHECSVIDHTGEVDNCHWVINPEGCSTLLALAAVYSDHADYQQDWGT